MRRAPTTAPRHSCRLVSLVACLVLGLGACKPKPTPTLQIEVTLLGNAELGRLGRVAEVQYTSRHKTGFIFPRNETQQQEVPVVIDGNRLLITLPKQDADGYELTYVRVPYDSDVDRRLRTAVSSLSFSAVQETWIPPVWPEDTKGPRMSGLGYYYERTADGVFRTRRYFLGEFLDLLDHSWSSVLFSTLENTRLVDVTIDFRALPYFVNLREVPDDELPSEPHDGAASDPGQTRDLRFDVTDFALMSGAKIHVAAVDPNVKLPFWDGQKLYPFDSAWSIVRSTDFNALQEAELNRRSKVNITRQSWTKVPNTMELPDAGRGQVALRYVESAGDQATSLVVGLEYQGTVFVRRVP